MNERYRIILITHAEDELESKEFVIFDYVNGEIVKFKGQQVNSIGFNACRGDRQRAKNILFERYNKIRS